MRYRVYISQVWNYTTIIEADSREEADDIAGEIAQDMAPNDRRPGAKRMTFGDEYVEVEPVKGGE